MPSIYRPRRPRASPLWQIVHHEWGNFRSQYESTYRKTYGPLRRDAVTVVDQFYRCGDLAAGFTRLHCPDCGHEKLLAFSCKTRHFCPSCHQRRVRQTGDWIAQTVCFEVPHRQFVFTMPRPLRGIFRKRRKLLHLLFKVSIDCLRDWMRVRLGLPNGQLAAIAAVQTFGDYLVFHPHLHVLAAAGLVDKEGRFHLMPVEKRRGAEAFWTEAEAEPAGRVRRAGRANQSIEPLAELFRHRFIQTLHSEKLISEKKVRQLLDWKHSGFSLDAGDKPIASDDVDGRRRLAEYLLRAPFSLEKMTWNETTGKVIYRSSRSWRTKRNYQIFTARDFLAAAVQHIPPKGQQTIRYYGLYSNKRRGMDAKRGRARPAFREAGTGGDHNGSGPSQPMLFVLPPPSAKSARALRPLWRDLIMRIWGEDPLICPCCKGTMKVVGTLIRHEEVEFFLRLHGLWEEITGLPPPPTPPYDIEKRRGSEAFWTEAEPKPAGRARQAGRANQTMEPLDMPPELRWIDRPDPPSHEWWSGDEEIWQAPELPLDDGAVLLLDADEPVHADT